MLYCSALVFMSLNVLFACLIVIVLDFVLLSAISDWLFDCCLLEWAVWE